jgi:arabinose-5-phosphate isomerase
MTPVLVSSTSYLTHARDVLKNEADALNALCDGINEQFDHVIDILGRVKGRVILTGIGKSGHIARKISSTLSSLGTPSFFVHPSEADHGDLGMLTAKDAIIALSNSGETIELKNLIAYAKKINIPLISMTRNANSALAIESTICLVLPPVPEACPMGLAPTTSTTMMLALGDAIAVCMLHQKGFSKTDYFAFHPGGQLGFYLTPVSKIMHTHSLPMVALGTSMNTAIIEMSSGGFGCVGVINDQGILCGMITDGDLRRHMSDHLLGDNVDDVMTLNPLTLKADIMVSDALTFMNDKKKTGIFIVDENTMPVGFLHIHDFIRNWRRS